MNYLQLATKLRTECGVSGTETSVTNASGEWGRLCGWVVTAWHEIQEENQGWEWMRKAVTFNTVAQQGEYSPTIDMALTDFGLWKRDSFRLYPVSAGIGSELELNFKDYDSFRNFYLLASRKTTYARPTEVTITPARNLIFGFAPDAIYTVNGEYYKAPVDLAIDADTPDMPSRFHNAIIYRAMMSYGAFEAAPEVYQRGEQQYKQILNKIRYDQAPAITRCGSFI